MIMHPASCRTTDQVRDVLAFVRRWECAVFQWEPPREATTWKGPGEAAEVCINQA
uniref:Uncharacterized protein n=1 Tax=Theropithecus gelada TaxID=9565 RepID=A0A8D2EZI3_THEGE